MVGLVIGRAGKTSSAQSGFRRARASREGGGTEEDPRRRRNAKDSHHGHAEGIDRAKKDLSEMIKTRKANGGWSTGPCAKTLVVDNSKIGLIIGKGGLTVKGIQERSGANVAIPSEADTDNPLKRTLTITGQTDEAVREASVEIENMLRNHDLSNGFDAPIACGALLRGAGARGLCRS